MSEMHCTRIAENTGRKNDAKKSPSVHHRTTLSGYIFATKACIDNPKKLVKIGLQLIGVVERLVAHRWCGSATRRSLDL